MPITTIKQINTKFDESKALADKIETFTPFQDSHFLPSTVTIAAREEYLDDMKLVLNKMPNTTLVEVEKRYTAFKSLSDEAFSFYNYDAGGSLLQTAIFGYIDSKLEIISKMPNQNAAELKTKLDLLEEVKNFATDHYKIDKVYHIGTLKKQISNDFYQKQL